MSKLNVASKPASVSRTVFQSRGFAAVLGAAMAVAVAGGSAVFADHSAGVIHGCVKSRTGALRIVTSASQCDPKSEMPIEWQREGPAGQQGLPGNLALAGQQCPAGQAVSGFDEQGQLLCVALDTTGGGDGGGNGTVGEPCYDQSSGTTGVINEEGHCVTVVVPDTDVDDDGYIGSQASGPDCNDGDPEINPGRPELAGDGIDNDCDGQVDEAEVVNETGNAE